MLVRKYRKSCEILEQYDFLRQRTVSLKPCGPTCSPTCCTLRIFFGASGFGSCASVVHDANSRSRAVIEDGIVRHIIVQKSRDFSYGNDSHVLEKFILGYELMYLLLRFEFPLNRFSRE